MTESEAESVARELLKDWIDIRPCHGRQEGPPIYGFDPKKHFLFEVQMGARLGMVGSPNYIVVSRSDGRSWVTA